MIWDRERYIAHCNFEFTGREMFCELFGLLIGLEEEWQRQGAVSYTHLFKIGFELVIGGVDVRFAGDPFGFHLADGIEDIRAELACTAHLFCLQVRTRPYFVVQEFLVNTVSRLPCNLRLGQIKQRTEIFTVQYAGAASVFHYGL